MKTLYLISLISFISYLIYAVSRVGIPKSLSDSYYLIKRGYLFQVALSISAGTLLPVMFENTVENFQLLAFFTCAGTMFVAFAPKFKEQLEGDVHRYSALVSGLSALLLCMFTGYTLIFLGWIALCFFFYSSGYEKFEEKNTLIFWLEMACFGSIYTVVFLKLFEIVK